MNCLIILFLVVLIILSEHFTAASLLYPAASVLQITSSVSAPIEIPDRKIFWDWGLQMNYDLPATLAQFYNAPIWPDTLEDRKRRDLVGTQSGDNQTIWHKTEKYNSESVKSGLHPSDFSAGELYQSLEDVLLSYGFHETCLLRSVCELAAHPFADDRQNLLTEILTFLLTPSIHEAFSESEVLYREAYEEAERRGFLHYNCAESYNECEQDLLTALTNVITSYEYNYDNEDKIKTQ